MQRTNRRENRMTLRQVIHEELAGVYEAGREGAGWSSRDTLDRIFAAIRKSIPDYEVAEPPTPEPEQWHRWDFPSQTWTEHGILPGLPRYGEIQLGEYVWLWGTSANRDHKRERFIAATWEAGGTPFVVNGLLEQIARLQAELAQANRDYLEALEEVKRLSRG